MVRARLDCGRAGVGAEVVAPVSAELRLLTRRRAAFERAHRAYEDAIRAAAQSHSMREVGRVAGLSASTVLRIAGKR